MKKQFNLFIDVLCKVLMFTGGMILAYKLLGWWGVIFGLAFDHGWSKWRYKEVDWVSMVKTVVSMAIALVAMCWPWLAGVLTSPAVFGPLAVIALVYYLWFECV